MQIELIREFTKSKTLRPDIKKPVWHNSLRLPLGDKLPNEKWNQIVDDYMQRMGFLETHLRLHILHDDPEGQHIHILATRISMDSGKIYLGKNENLKSTRHIAILEQKYNLTITKGPSYDPNSGKVIMPQQRKPKAGEIGWYNKSGKTPSRMKLQSILDTAIQGHPTMQEFISQLEGANVLPKPNIASTGKMNGFSFLFEDVAFKASHLGKRYTWKNLKELVDYEQTRDTKVLSATRDKATKSANQRCIRPSRCDRKHSNSSGTNRSPHDQHPEQIKLNTNPTTPPGDCSRPKVRQTRPYAEENGQSSKESRQSGIPGNESNRGINKQADQSKQTEFWTSTQNHQGHNDNPWPIPTKNDSNSFNYWNNNINSSRIDNLVYSKEIQRRRQELAGIFEELQPSLSRSTASNKAMDGIQQQIADLQQAQAQWKARNRKDIEQLIAKQIQQAQNSIKAITNALTKNLKPNKSWQPAKIYYRTMAQTIISTSNTETKFNWEQLDTLTVKTMLDRNRSQNQIHKAISQSPQALLHLREKNRDQYINKLISKVTKDHSKDLRQRQTTLPTSFSPRG